MFGRPAVLPVDVILGVPTTFAPQSKMEYTRQTVERLQLAYELARRNLKERADSQASVNATLSFPHFNMGEQVLLHRPPTPTDGPNPKLVSPWHGPYTVRAQLSPVIYCASKDGDSAEITVHLGRLKKYLPPRDSSVPDLSALDDIFLGTTLPVPDLEGSLNAVKLGPYIVEGIDGHKRGVGSSSPSNFQYHLLLKGYSPALGVWKHHREIPQCAEMIESYRLVVLSRDPSAFDPPRTVKKVAKP